MSISSGRCNVLDARSWEPVQVIPEVGGERGTYEIKAAKWLPGLLWLKTRAPISGFFEATTWEPALAPAGFPEFTEDFVSLGGGKYLVLSREDKLTIVMDGKASFEFPEAGVTKYTAAANADTFLTAVAYQFGTAGGKKQVRLLIMETDTGKRMHELFPFELNTQDDPLIQELFRNNSSMSLCWSKDGNYLLGVLPSGQTAIWNAKNGRHRATLENRSGSVNASVMSPDGATLYQYLWDGRMLYYNMETVVKKVKALEAELSQATGK